MKILFNRKLLTVVERTPAYALVTTRFYAGHNDNDMFSLQNMQSQAYCIAGRYSVSDMPQFITALARLSSLNLSSSSLIITAINVLLLHACTYLACTSKFATHIVSNTRHVIIPSYIHAIITKISIEVNSRNKSEGWTHGSMHTCSSPNDVKKILLGLLDDNGVQLNYLLSGTVLSKIVSDKKIRSAFTVDFKTEIHKLFADSLHDQIDDDGIDRILDLFSRIPETFYDSRRSLPMFTGYLANSVSSSISVYRFRNVNQDSTRFAVNQASWGGINVATKDFLCSFLKINRPIYYYGGADPFVFEGLLPAEGLLDLEYVNFLDTWIKYLSFSVISVPKRRKSNSKDRFNDFNNLKDPVSDVSNSSEDTTSRTLYRNKLVSSTAPLSTPAFPIYTIKQNRFVYVGDVIDGSFLFTSFTSVVPAKFQYG